MAWIFTQQSKFYLHEGETLLRGLLRAGYPARYECCGGYCGTCKVKCSTIGQVDIRYFQEPLALLEEDEILPCSCQVFGVLQISLDEH